MYCDLTETQLREKILAELDGVKKDAESGILGDLSDILWDKDIPELNELLSDSLGRNDLIRALACYVAIKSLPE